MEQIVLATYDLSWPLKFNEERGYLLDTIGSWNYGGIEHVGSTAVPGLVAKPVIDMMFGVQSLDDSRRAIEVLSTTEYHYFPYKNHEMHWFCKPSSDFRTHHLHLIPYLSPLWNERIAFRDLLRAKPKIASEYADLKVALAASCKGDRELYTSLKWPFIERVLGINKSG